MTYQWDRVKAEANLLKHKVDFADAALALEDPHALTLPDETSAAEDRLITLAMDPLGRILVIVFTMRGDQVRVISARRATPRERNQYEGRR